MYLLLINSAKYMIQVVFTKHLLCGSPLRGVPCHLTVFFPWAFFVDIKTGRVEFDNAFEQKKPREVAKFGHIH